jgi:hypothetical protein
VAESLEIKDTKEVLVGLLKIAGLFAEVMKDGLKADDVAVIIQKISSDENLKKALLDAYNGIDKVPSEIKDISLPEAFNLAAVVFPEVLLIIKKIQA